MLHLFIKVVLRSINVLLAPVQIGHCLEHCKARPGWKVKDNVLSNSQDFRWGSNCSWGAIARGEQFQVGKSP